MLQAITRPPTARELARLRQQLDQLAIANPVFVTAIAVVVHRMIKLQKTGHAVPVPTGRR